MNKRSVCQGRRIQPFKEIALSAYMGQHVYPCGLLRYSGKTFSFTYSNQWLDAPKAFPLSPDMPLGTGTMEFFHLPGPFSDATADAFGQKAMRHAAFLAGGLLDGNPIFLDDFDCFANTHPLGRQGGFVFPDDAAKLYKIKTFEKAPDKDGIRNFVLSVDREHADVANFLKFIKYVHALGGMRPKYVFLDRGALWMAKTVSQEDVFSDGVFWEAVNLTMASLCGITVPPFTYDNGWLCVQRFDRENGTPVPYISAKTLLLAHGAHEDYRHYSYADIADRCNEKDAQEVFRRCCFNVAVANCDDHLKNHGFLLKNGDWTLSPVFDVMSMPVPAFAQEHSLVIGSRYEFGSLQNLVADAHRFHLSVEEAESIAKGIFSIVRHTWEHTAKALGANDAKMAYMASAYVHDRNCAQL